MLYPMQTADYLHLVLYFSANIIIVLFWKYLIDIKSETFLTLFGEYINGKLFAVQSLYM
jgi:hypothetical protein